MLGSVVRKLRTRGRRGLQSAACAVIRATRPAPSLPGDTGYLTLFHDYEGRYAMPEMAEASYEGVRAMLEIEKRHGVRTTYNIVGKLALDVPGVVERIVADGHEVAGHSFDHRLMTDLTRSEVADDVRATIRAFASHGVRIRGMRAPKGRWSFHLLRTMARAGLRWSAEADGAPAPYVIVRGLVRFPVRLGDHKQYRLLKTPDAVLARYISVAEEVARTRTYGALGFHPWVQARPPERLRAYDALVERLVAMPGIRILPFADLAEILARQNR